MSDILRRYVRSPQLGRYERDSIEESIERMLLETGQLRSSPAPEFVHMIDTYFEQLQRVLGMSMTDVVRIK